MNRDAFMSELEYLLQDIPDEEKAEALQYYRDYFDEAGPEQENRVLEEFGSPERVAAIIRSDLAGSLEEGGSFTERGYEDERFRDPNYQMAQRYDLPEERDLPRGHREQEREGRSDAGRLLKIALLVLLVLALAPPLFGVAGGALGILCGIAGILLAAAIAVGAVTAALFIAGTAILIVGAVNLPMNTAAGLLLLGAGLLILGFGFLMLAVAVLFYGRFLPFLLRSVTDLLSRLFNGRRAKP